MLIFIYCILLEKVINFIFINISIANLEYNNYYTFDDFFTPIILFSKFLLSIYRDNHLECPWLQKNNTLLIYYLNLHSSVNIFTRDEKLTIIICDIQKTRKFYQKMGKFTKIIIIKKFHILKNVNCNWH